ncbi:MAG: hypothetical protein Q8N51_00880 [Gammaproteobacteria bacterium]|nr:hypothetical protein [Gammaproteobacteria bacterium]
MSLASDLTAGVAAAFTALGDLVQTMQVRRTVLGTYSTTTHTASQTPTDYAFDGVVSNDEQVIGDGGLVERVRTVILKPGPVVPATTDHLVIGSDVCRILEVVAAKPASTVFAWTLKVAE